MTWTIVALLRWTTDYFAAHQVSEPRASAEVLLAHCLGLPRLHLYLRHDQPLTTGELGRFKAMLKRRLAGEPTQYITGRQEFWSLEFQVSPAVLIPRPETEVLLETALEYARGPDGPTGRPWALDVGTGSGALAVALARELAGLQVVALDVSRPALTCAAANAARHGVADRITFLQGDLLKPLAPRSQFHLLLSNPPYIPTAEIAHLPREILDFEPRGALDGGPDGLASIGALSRGAHRYLAPGGLLALEVGLGQATAVKALLEDTGAYGAVGSRRDYQGIARVVWARRRG